MTTPRERAQKSARPATAKGVTGMVLGLAAMLISYSPGHQLTFIAAGIFTFGTLLYTAGSVIAVRRTTGA